VIDVARLEDRLGERAAKLETLPATTAAEAATGDGVGFGLLMLGYAWQRGEVPLPAAAIEAAIRLNGVAVARNLAAFAWGRRLAADPGALGHLGVRPAEPEGLDELIDRRSAFLRDYQNEAWARRYRELVDRVRRRERAVAPDSDALGLAVARAAFKLMAYKDEYEVARLHADPAFRRRIDAMFGGDFRLRFHLAPPLLARPDPVTGKPRKRAYGGWMLHVFRLLAPLKVLRGTPFDPFGHTAERRLERQLIEDYFARVDALMADLTRESLPTAVELAELPLRLRGFGHVKLAALDEVRRRERELLERWEALRPA
jgi:indolepyruvate ferredoxin oxidoreductase